MIDWDGMSLAEKVGQLLMVGFTGTDADGPVSRLLADRQMQATLDLISRSSNQTDLLRRAEEIAQ